MKRPNRMWGDLVERLKIVNNIIKHNEKVQNLIIVICCFGLIGIIALWCLLFR